MGRDARYDSQPLNFDEKLFLYGGILLVVFFAGYYYGQPDKPSLPPQVTTVKASAIPPPVVNPTIGYVLTLCWEATDDLPARCLKVVPP